MRLIQGLIAVIFILAGVLFSALNPTSVVLDFYVYSWQSSLGVALLSALLAGTLLGGILVAATVIWPLKARLRKLQRQQNAQASTPTNASAAP
jgi:lipopolysaccharide assembly protein A